MALQVEVGKVGIGPAQFATDGLGVALVLPNPAIVTLPIPEMADDGVAARAIVETAYSGIPSTSGGNWVASPVSSIKAMSFTKVVGFHCGWTMIRLTGISVTW